MVSHPHKRFAHAMRRVLSLAAPLAAAALAACADHALPVDPLSGVRQKRAVASAPAATDFDLTLQDVALRPGVTVDIHLRVFVDEDYPAAKCNANKTAVAVPGYAHTAATWGPFAEALFADTPQKICRLVAIDFPGHGLSGLPEGGLSFSNLTLEDYATVVLAVLQALPQHGIEARVLFGHSQGGMVVQIAQQRLVDEGSSLREAFDVKDVVLLSPTMPAALPWAFVENGTAGQLLSNFFVPADPVLGPHFVIPDAAWLLVFFSNLSGQIVSGAPSVADVAALGYNAPEPLVSSLELVGAPPIGQRPAIDAGIFASRYGSQLTIIAFENDIIVRPEEAAALYAYLTGKHNGGKFAVVHGSEAVHDTYLSDPAALLNGTHVVLP